MQLSFADRVFFGNSGAEANEGAIKLCRRYSREKFGPNRYKIICAQNSFHGRTLATLSATGQEKFWQGFEPLLPGFAFVPFNDLAAMEMAIDDQTCAILVEPIQGEGGVKLPSPEYLPGLRRLCDQHQLLLVLDEIQVGLGRTGKLFAYEHFDFRPDIITLAKALANGLPIGALLVTEEVAQGFVPGTHASTFGGGPVVTCGGPGGVGYSGPAGVFGRGDGQGRVFPGGLTAVAGPVQFYQRGPGAGIDHRGGN